MPFAPQLADSLATTDVTSYINNPAWVMEQKLDGNRVILIYCEGGPPTALTRGGALYTKGISTELRNFRWSLSEDEAVVLDGEYVNGIYWAFDLLGVGKINVSKEPLWKRRAMLEGLLGSCKHPFRLVPQARTPEQKQTLITRSKQDNFEGLIIKRDDSPYRHGARTREWMKVKYVETADVVVLAVRDDGKDSILLGAYDDQGHMQEVGRTSLIGKEKRRVVKVGDIVEVRYLYLGAGGRLYQPTFLKVRDDKPAQDCRTSQFKHVCKNVLETLS